MADGRNRTVRAAVLTGNRMLDFFVRETPGLQAALQPVSYSAGHVLHRQDKPMFHAYFPLTGSIALTIATSDGSSCEAMAIGNEGLLGLALYCGLTTSPNTVVQQIDGRAYRLAAATFVDSIRKSAALQRLMLRYSAYTVRFAHQTTACNTLHSVRQRACRWRLMVQDRAGPAQFELPLAIHADMLGVRRQSVSAVASELRRQGRIEYSRVVIVSANRRTLEAAACCACYAVMNNYYGRMLDPAD
jgi:CRP-like cAMP-binding protein